MNPPPHHTWHDRDSAPLTANGLRDWEEAAACALLPSRTLFVGDSISRNMLISMAVMLGGASVKVQEAKIRPRINFVYLDAYSVCGGTKNVSQARAKGVVLDVIIVCSSLRMIDRSIDRSIVRSFIH